MIPERQTSTTLPVVLSLLTALVLVLPVALLAQSHQPPPEPPAAWGPISINMEGDRVPASGRVHELQRLWPGTCGLPTWTSRRWDPPTAAP